jgi:50S ribosomal protein L16 3-hydroxylase
LSLRPDAPLRILRRFRPAESHVLGPGDMLYLPPQYAHEGVALSDCITCSIGFRAPSAQELGTRFLEFMQERLRLTGVYGDPDLRSQRRPGAIGTAMVRRVGRMLEGVRWDADDVEQFLGCYLTEPKAQVVFRRPARPLAARAFAAGLARRGAHLALPTRMLFRGRTVFINGEARTLGRRAASLAARLADRRALAPQARVEREAMDVLYEWYRAGYINLDEQ